MAYDIIEASSHLGTPVEFYEFTRSSKAWRYTSGDNPVTFLGSDYMPIPISRSSVVESQDIGKSPVTIDTTRSNDFVQEYISAPPNVTVNLIIRRYHSSDPDIIVTDTPTESDIDIVWMGRVLNVSFKDDSAKIRCESIFTSFKRSTLRRAYQTACTHAVYGTSCGVDRQLHVLSVPVDTVNGKAVSAAGFASEADGHFTGGFVEAVIDSAIDRRQIISHVGSTITLGSAIKGLASGIVISAFPGCDRSPNTCNTKFSNLPNHGGFPYIPEKNPFDSQSIF